MDSAESSIKTWLKFFMDASIPAGVATEYAISFSDNRMRLDMLPDLTKDYLRDLDITVLGDVIAILKHAKCVSHQEYKARKIDSSGGLSPSPSPPPPPPPAAPAVKKSAISASGESPASRMVKRLVRTETAPAAGGRLKRAADCLQDDVEDGVVGPKRRLLASGRLGTPQGKAVSGGGGGGGGKRTVFDRLGGGSSEGQVSSTTPDPTTRFRITGLSGPAATQRAPLHAEAAPPSPPTALRHRVTFLSEMARPSPPPSRPGGLSYKGVLKSGAAAERTTAATGTKRKAGPVTSTLASDREAAAAVSARSRVGSTAPAPARTSRTVGGVRARLSGRTAPAPAAGRGRSGPAPAGVKARLGGGGGGGPGSVLNRLGTAAR